MSRLWDTVQIATCPYCFNRHFTGKYHHCQHPAVVTFKEPPPRPSTATWMISPDPDFFTITLSLGDPAPSRFHRFMLRWLLGLHTKLIGEGR